MHIHIYHIIDCSNIFGIELCAEAQYSPNPTSPHKTATYFAGPSKAQIHMHKTDTFDKYIFKYQYSQEDIDPPNPTSSMTRLQGQYLLGCIGT
jgi:hypothetical protein